MAITEARKRWLAAYHEARELLRAQAPGHNNAWYRHHARTRADMACKGGRK